MTMNYTSFERKNHRASNDVHYARVSPHAATHSREKEHGGNCSCIQMEIFQQNANFEKKVATVVLSFSGLNFSTKAMLIFKSAIL
jgi:hypothetical protein